MAMKKIIQDNLSLCFSTLNILHSGVLEYVYTGGNNYDH